MIKRNSFSIKFGKDYLILNLGSKIWFVIAWLSLGCVTTLCAQTITPNQAPIYIMLDAAGSHRLQLSDVATIDNGTGYQSIYPASFDCDDLGEQGVYVAGNRQNAMAVSFNHPAGLVLDAAGNLYISELDGQTIRKMTPQGVVTTFAGSGAVGNTNGLGTSASFNHPTGLTIDRQGNIYVADGGNHVIRKITPAGLVTTFAGSGTRGNTNGSALTATFEDPSSMAFDGFGNLFVADDVNNNIREITVQGVVKTLAGSGYPGNANGTGTSASFTSPTSLVMDGDDNIFVTDVANFLLRKVTPQGVVTTIAGNGLQKNINGRGTAAGFNTLQSITQDALGNLFVYSGTQIRKITPAGDVSTFAGKTTSGLFLDGKDTTSRFNGVNAIITGPDGNLYAADTYNNMIRLIKPTSDVITLAGNLVAATVNGNVGELATIEQRQVQIKVIVRTHVTLTTPPPDVSINYSGCAAILRSYSGGVSDYCEILNSQKRMPKPYYYVSTQVPAPGTLLQNDVATPVTLIYGDRYGVLAQVTFTVTAHNGNNSKPQEKVEIVASANPVCEGTPVTFKANITNGPISPSYTWTLNGDIVSRQDYYTSGMLKDGDAVACIVTEPNSVCAIPATSEPFIVTIAAPLMVSFATNPLITLGGNVQLLPKITGDAASYSWSPAQGINDVTKANPIASPTETTTYQLITTGTGGCVVLASVTVFVNKDNIKIPNAFSPNGDGYNDTWNMPLLSALSNTTVAVYDRYGQRVYYSNGYSIPWDGTLSGKQLPVGTYYYIIKTGKEALLSGEVTIIR